MYKHRYSPSLTQHCDELDINLALALCGTVRVTVELVTTYN